MRHTFTLDSIHKTYISQVSLFTLRKNAQPQVKKALSGVSITLTPGLYGLLGPNGAGKSTFTSSQALLLLTPVKSSGVVSPHRVSPSAAFLAICHSSRGCMTVIPGGVFLPTWLP